MRARRNGCLRARIVAGVYMEELAGPASAMQIRIRETLEKRETGEDDGKEQRMCDTDEVDDMPGILTRWRTMPAEYRVSGTSKVARSSLHVGHHLARLPYTASPLFCDWEPSCSRPLRRPSQARLPPVRACLEQECLAHALAAGIRNILGSHYCQSLATAHQFIQRGRQITAARDHAQICGTNTTRLVPAFDLARIDRGALGSELV